MMHQQHQQQQHWLYSINPFISYIFCLELLTAVLAALRRKGKGSDVSEDQMLDVVRAHNGKAATAHLLPTQLAAQSPLWLCITAALH